MSNVRTHVDARARRQVVHTRSCLADGGDFIPRLNRATASHRPHCRIDEQLAAFILADGSCARTCGQLRRTSRGTPSGIPLTSHGLKSRRARLIQSGASCADLSVKHKSCRNEVDSPLKNEGVAWRIALRCTAGKARLVIPRTSVLLTVMRSLRLARPALAPAIVEHFGEHVVARRRCTHDIRARRLCMAASGNLGEGRNASGSILAALLGLRSAALAHSYGVAPHTPGRSYRVSI